MKNDMGSEIGFGVAAGGREPKGVGSLVAGDMKSISSLAPHHKRARRGTGAIGCVFCAKHE